MNFQNTWDNSLLCSIRSRNYGDFSTETDEFQSGPRQVFQHSDSVFSAKCQPTPDHLKRSVPTQSARHENDKPAQFESRVKTRTLRRSLLKSETPHVRQLVAVHRERMTQIILLVSVCQCALQRLDHHQQCHHNPQHHDKHPHQRIRLHDHPHCQNMTMCFISTQ